MKALQFILVLALLACPAAMAEVTVVVDDAAPLSCYGFVGSVAAGTTTTVSFCSTGHACNMETQRAGNAICASTFAAECAKRDCPEGQECVPIELAGSEDIALTNCRRLPAPGRHLCHGRDLRL